MFKRSQRLAHVRTARVSRAPAALETLERRTLMAAVEWVGGLQGNWNEAANWSGGFVPGVNDDVLIDGQQGDTTVTFAGGTHTVNSLFADEARLSILGGALTLSNGGNFTFYGGVTLSGGTLTTGTNPGARLRLGPFGTFDMSGGVLKGDLLLSFQNSFYWSGGEMASPGTTTVGEGANPYSYINGGSNTVKLSRPLIYNGRGLYVGGNLLFSNGTLDFNSQVYALALGDCSILSGGGENMLSGRVYVEGDVHLDVPTNVSGPVSGGALHLGAGGTGDFSVAGSGELHIDATGYSLGVGDVQYSSSGNVFFNSGTTTVRELSTTGGAYVSGAGTRVTFGDSVDVGALFLGSGTRARMNGTGSNVLRTRTLSLGGNAALDIGQESLIVDYDASSPLSTIRALVTDGYAGGGWNGPGIPSSAAADTAGFAVGYAEASDIFSSFPASIEGHEVDDTSVVVRHTRIGDANLDRTVNLADFNRLASNFGSQFSFWSQGDFTYDRTVNLQDFNRLASNFGQGASASSAGARSLALDDEEQPPATDEVVAL